MGVKSANQHLTVFVSTEAAAYKDPTPGTITDILDDAKLVPGAITYTSSRGLNYDVIADAIAKSVADGDIAQYNIVYKDANSVIHRRGPILEGDLISQEETKAYVAPVEQVDTIVISNVGIVAGDEYRVTMAVPNYGGMISQQDEPKFYGSHVATAIDSATTIAIALAVSLEKRMASLPVRIATITNGVAGTVTITGEPQPYIRAKWDGKQVNFNSSLSSPELLMGAATTTNSANKTPGIGTWKEVASMEEFYAGYNSDYMNRDADFPANGNPTLAAVSGGTYLTSSFTYRSASADTGSILTAQRQEIVCYFAQ